MIAHSCTHWLMKHLWEPAVLREAEVVAGKICWLGTGVHAVCYVLFFVCSNRFMSKIARHARGMRMQ